MISRAAVVLPMYATYSFVPLSNNAQQVEHIALCTEPQPGVKKNMAYFANSIHVTPPPPEVTQSIHPFLVPFVPIPPPVPSLTAVYPTHTQPNNNRHSPYDTSRLHPCLSYLLLRARQAPLTAGGPMHASLKKGIHTMSTTGVSLGLPSISSEQKQAMHHAPAQCTSVL